MVEASSDSSSAGTGEPKAAHVTIETPPPPIETAEDRHRNGYLFTGERKHSRAEKDDDDEEDLDMLIEELESLDPDEMSDEENDPMVGRQVPEELLQTDTTQGLVEPEVIQRRKKYGLNMMKEEKENLFLKFLGYFVGPIQFVMEVSRLQLRQY
jgi:H+-transporting ATPase